MFKILQLQSKNLTFFRSTSHAIGVGNIYAWIQDFINKLREIRVDKTEFACLRAVILFNPGKNFFF